MEHVQALHKVLSRLKQTGSRAQEPSTEELWRQLSSSLSNLATPEIREQLAVTSNTPGQELAWQLATDLLPWALGSCDALPAEQVTALLRAEVVLVDKLLGVLGEGEADQLLAAVCGVLPRLAKRPDGPSLLPLLCCVFVGRLRPNSQVLEILKGQRPQIQAAIIQAHLDALPASQRGGSTAEELAALTADGAQAGMQDAETEISGCLQCLELLGAMTGWHADKAGAPAHGALPAGIMPRLSSALAHLFALQRSHLLLCGAQRLLFWADALTRATQVLHRIWEACYPQPAAAGTAGHGAASTVAASALAGRVGGLLRAQLDILGHMESVSQARCRLGPQEQGAAAAAGEDFNPAPAPAPAPAGAGAGAGAGAEEAEEQVQRGLGRAEGELARQEAILGQLRLLAGADGSEAPGVEGLIGVVFVGGAATAGAMPAGHCEPSTQPGSKVEPAAEEAADEAGDAEGAVAAGPVEVSKGGHAAEAGGAHLQERTGRHLAMPLRCGSMVLTARDTPLEGASQAPPSLQGTRAPLAPRTASPPRQIWSQPPRAAAQRGQRLAAGGRWQRPGPAAVPLPIPLPAKTAPEHTGA